MAVAHDSCFSQRQALVPRSAADPRLAAAGKDNTNRPGAAGLDRSAAAHRSLAKRCAQKPSPEQNGDRG